jgi:hypothetical protein
MSRLVAFLAALNFFCGIVRSASAEDAYTVVALSEPAPADELSADVAAKLSPTGFKVIKGENRTVCSFWPVKELATNPDFKPTPALLYPLTLGELVGAINFKRDAQDFRGQEIPKGTYTVRFALQPEDGNHVGTSDTRDFVVLLKPSDDANPAVMAKEELFKKSAASIESTHPCMLSLLAAGDAKPAAPTVEHDKGRELWSVLFAANTQGNGTLPIKLVVVGKAAE